MELKDLTPRRVEFKLNVVPDSGEETILDLAFRPWTLRDDSWQARHYETKDLETMFKELDMYSICRIAFYMLTNKSKEIVLGIKLIDIDDEGEKVEVKSGAEKLRYLISGPQDQIRLYTSLLEAKGLSLPVLNEAVNEELKKNGLEEVNLIGLLSTT